MKKEDDLALSDEKKELLMKDHEKFMRDMNSTYNEKFKEV